MEEKVKSIAQISSDSLEILGIAVIVLFAAFTTINALVEIIKKANNKNADKKIIYEKYRHQFSRGIIIGLELLVAADIIRTVAIELTFQNVGVLAAIIVIRTFLSFVLEVEMTGRWPWQGKEDNSMH
jgi:uncharacterized membrane protein